MPTCNCRIHLGDSLTINLAYVDCDQNALDVSSATTQEVIIQCLATREVISSSFVTHGSDGLVTATVDAGLIDQTGTWQIQGRIVISGTPDIEYHSEIKTFEVDGNL